MEVDRVEQAVDGVIVVLGDTQRTSWGEVALLGREQNEVARHALIEKIAAEERLAFVVHLGDMVDAGGVAESWKYFDQLMSPLSARHIPILPVFGNHDRWGSEREVMRHVRARFPQLGSGGYYDMKFGELGLIWLDSTLQGRAGAVQSEWLERTLLAFDRDAEVRGVVLFGHHPAYTNGKRRLGDRSVRERLLPRMLAAKKTLALMSGHVHGYERFYVQGRHFVVSGGGGGPRVEYLLPPHALYDPAYVTPTGSPRPFNYVVLQRTSDALTFTVKCLNLNGECPGGIIERFSAAYAATT